VAGMLGSSALAALGFQATSTRRMSRVRKTPVCRRFGAGSAEVSVARGERERGTKHVLPRVRDAGVQRSSVDCCGDRECAHIDRLSAARIVSVRRCTVSDARAAENGGCAHTRERRGGRTVDLRTLTSAEAAERWICAHSRPSVGATEGSLPESIAQPPRNHTGTRSRSAIASSWAIAASCSSINSALTARRLAETPARDRRSDQRWIGQPGQMLILLVQ
jgi:hypothetical protein